MNSSFIIKKIALMIFVIFSIVLAVSAYSFGGVDFNVYYAAARITLAGGNPYNFQELAPQLISDTGQINNPYYYAPWFTWLIIPFSIFEYHTARLLWLFFNYIAWLLALSNASKIIGYPQHDWGKWLFWLMVTFVFAWSTWGSEQVGILILFLFTLILFFYQQKNWIALGICLAIILFKPNISVIPVLAIILWLIIHKRQWIPLFTLVGSILTMVLISILITPNWFMAFLQPDKLQGLSYTLDSSGTEEIQRYTTTLLNWLSVYGFDKNVAIGVYLIAIFVGVLTLIYSIIYLDSVLEVSIIAILINFAVIPYALFYDYPLIILTLCWCHARLVNYPKYKWIGYTVNSLLVFILFVGNSIPYRYWITITIALFLIISYFLRLNKQEVAQNNIVIS